jgi:UDP-N-acetylglucosamine 4-epimerase
VSVGPRLWPNFRLIEGDICGRDVCSHAVQGVDYVLHQAALGSVPHSIDDPAKCHDTNVTGFLNLLEAARGAGVKRFVYAASSSTYGDEPGLPKREDRIGSPLSPYAATKLINEIYAAVYARSYNFSTIGLRYFNVFGPRQDPAGAYAAVIPAWTAAMIKDEPVEINGDGSTTRDFCYVADAVQANLRAALAGDSAQDQVYNVAGGKRASLTQLFELIQRELSAHQMHFGQKPVYRDFRKGDVLHSQADISKASKLLGYCPTYDIAAGISEAMPWYIQFCRS